MASSTLCVCFAINFETTNSLSTVASMQACSSQSSRSSRNIAWLRHTLPVTQTTACLSMGCDLKEGHVRRERELQGPILAVLLMVE